MNVQSTINHQENNSQPAARPIMSSRPVKSFDKIKSFRPNAPVLKRRPLSTPKSQGTIEKDEQ